MLYKAVSIICSCSNAESMTSDEEDMSLLAPPSKLSRSPSMSPRSKTVVRPDLSTVNKSPACQDANEVNDSGKFTSLAI